MMENKGKVFIGTIVASMPESGIALVATNKGSLEADNLYVGHLPACDSNTGVAQQYNLPDGSAVVCRADSSKLGKAYIVGPVNFSTGDIHDSVAGRATYRVDDYMEVENKTFPLLVTSMLGSNNTELKCFAHSVDGNALPGDWDAIDSNGNVGLHIGRSIVQLRGSANAFLDMSSITDTIRVVAQNKEEHTPLSVDIISKELQVHDIAISDSEAFGLASGTPFRIVDDTPEFVDNYALPLYRIQRLEGAAIDGIELSVVDFPDTFIHDLKTEPPVLARQRVSLTGAWSTASANSILSVKSPAIEAIFQIAYDSAKDRQLQQDILQPYEYQAKEQQETKPTDIDDTAINKLIDKLFSADYLDKLLQKMAEHGLQVSTKEGLLANRIKATGNFKTGPTQDQQYELPDTITLTDPVTGKETTYYASTSFISQEPDGSILICDGYGSEIRMTRGNIYISPALDLLLRPGRDLSTMVPRYQTFNAQDYTTINSSKSIYVRAANDLKLIGATSKTGIVTIENNATAQDTAYSGVLIKSLTGATLVGKDIYIGRNKGTGLATNTVEDPGPGAIVIDAGENGSLYTRSSDFVADSGMLSLVASGFSDTSVIRISPNMLGFYTPGIEVTGNVYISDKKSPEKITLYRNGQPQQFNVSAANEPWLQVDGGLGVDGSATIQGNLLVTKQFGASTIYYDGRYQPQGVEVSARTNPFKEVPFESLEGHEDMGVQATGQVNNLSNSIYQDAYITLNAFTFPTYSVTLNNVPSMMWQADNHDKHLDTFWQEQEIISVTGSTTMCYPGLYAWSKATVSYRNNEKLTLNDGYIINI